MYFFISLRKYEIVFKIDKYSSKFILNITKKTNFSVGLNMAGIERFELPKWLVQSQLPYRLAISQQASTILPTTQKKCKHYFKKIVKKAKKLFLSQLSWFHIIKTLKFLEIYCGTMPLFSFCVKNARLVFNRIFQIIKQV